MHYSFECLTGRCQQCPVSLHAARDVLEEVLQDPEQTEVKWFWWGKRDQGDRQNKMMQNEMSGTVEELLGQLEADLNFLKMHLFTAHWQQ